MQPGGLKYLLYFRSYRRVTVETLLEQSLYVFALNFVKIEFVISHLIAAIDRVLQVIGILFSQHHIQSDSSLPDINLSLVLRFHVELI